MDSTFQKKTGVLKMQITDVAVKWVVRSSFSSLSLGGSTLCRFRIFLGDGLTQQITLNGQVFQKLSFIETNFFFCEDPPAFPLRSPGQLAPLLP